MEYWTQDENGDDKDGWEVDFNAWPPDPSVGLFGYEVEVASVKHIETGEPMSDDEFDREHDAILARLHEHISEPPEPPDPDDYFPLDRFEDY